ncbi:hypothetical protein AB0K52_19865 [Glycomyces sp. NPDC049804]|uniref:hypothetical protein n=1 Tax=Glycomyces sp. NPDC049804 TaxID=3154363 RepID=UPI0034353632
MEAEFVFYARAVTDEDQGVLSIYCGARYDYYNSVYGDPMLPYPFDDTQRVLQACVSGAGNDAIGPDELSA